MVIVFGHATIAGLGETKLPLDDPKGVLHFGSNAGLGLLQQLLWIVFMKLFSLSWHHRNIPVDLAVLVLWSFLNPSIA